MVSPTGTHPDGYNSPASWREQGANGMSGFCAWHSYGNVAFTNLPYIPDMGYNCGANFVNGGTAGLLDGLTIVAGHEYAETVTDQIPGYGWIGTAGNDENADKCAWVGVGGMSGASNVQFATGQYAMQATWANDANGCEISHPINTSLASDYSISATADNAIVRRGTRFATSVTTSEAGAPQALTLRLGGAPAGVTGTFGAAHIVTPGSTRLTIAVGSRTRPGTYNLQVNATGGTSHTANIRLTVTVPNLFSIYIPRAIIPRGTRHAIAIRLTTTSGHAQPVTLSIHGLPAGVSARFSTTRVSSTSIPRLIYTVSRYAQVSPHAVTIIARGPYDVLEWGALLYIT